MGLALVLGDGVGLALADALGCGLRLGLGLTDGFGSLGCPLLPGAVMPEPTLRSGTEASWPRKYASHDRTVRRYASEWL